MKLVRFLHIFLGDVSTLTLRARHWGPGQVTAQEPLELVGGDHGGGRVVGLGLGGGRARDGRRRLQTRLALLHRVRHHLGVKVST